MLSIRATSLDKAAIKDYIFTMSFLTLYPTGIADSNSPRVRKIYLTDYTAYIIQYKDSRFARYSRWHFLIFNILIQQKARKAAGFYVLKSKDLQGCDKEALLVLLETDNGILPQVIRQASYITSTRPFWNNRYINLQAITRFLCPKIGCVFITLSCADI